MNFQDIYATTLGAVFVMFMAWHAAEASWVLWQRRVVPMLRKYVGQSLVITRRNGSSDFSVAAGLCILALTCGNVAACAINVHTRPQLARRLASVTIVNLVPLYLGGRTSFVVERVFGLSLTTYRIIHRWLGWICLTQGLGHGLLALSLQAWAFSLPAILLFSASIALAIGSILYFRRKFFEFFLKTHLLLAISVNVALWFHVQRGSNPATVCLVVASALWAAQTTLWLGRIAYRNIGGRTDSSHSLVPLSHDGEIVEAVRLEVGLRRPWKVRHGQYVYITLPSTHRGGVQAHPFLIAWSAEDHGGTSTDLTLLIECHAGFTQSLQAAHHPANIIVDGPYGQGADLDNFDKVMFIAGGIGISAHLLAIRHLLNAHEAQTARIRRLTLYWILEFTGQDHWARHFLEKLVQLDIDNKRRIFTIVIYAPAGAKSVTLPNTKDDDPKKSRLVSLDDDVNFSQLINGEWSSEAGNMAVSVCGTPLLEQRVRAALRRLPYDVHLDTSPFQMDETSKSRKAAERLVKRYARRGR